MLAVPASVHTEDEAELRTILSFPPGCFYRARVETWLIRRRDATPGLAMRRFRDMAMEGN